MLAGIAVTGLVVFNLALVEGSRHAEPAVLGVAVAGVPALLAVIGPLLEGSRPRSSLVAAALVVTCGAGLVQGLGRTDAVGVAWAAVVFGCEAAFTLLALPVLRRHGPWGVSVHATWLATVMFAVLGMAREGPAAVTRLSRPDWLAVGYLAVAVTAAAFVLWFAVSGVGEPGLPADLRGRCRRGRHRRPARRPGPRATGLGRHRGRRGRPGVRLPRGEKLMYFQHSAGIWRDFPALAPGVLYAEGITSQAEVRVDAFAAAAKARLADGPEGERPEIQAWRRAFTQMGLKPTQYRCASESLLRRFRKEGSLPRLHPLVDLCNAVSLAFAIPVAAFDAAAVAWPLEVRYAAGDEDYLTFGGDTEHPAAGEVIFADQAGRAHARRWTAGRAAFPRSAMPPPPC